MADPERSAKDNMKAIFLTILTLSLMPAVCLAVPLGSPIDLDLRVMSFNIRNSHARDGENNWYLRKELVYEVIRNYSPDVLGLQEANRFQMDEFNKQFPEYAATGIGSGGETKGQYSAILYLKKRFEVSESGNFWLSETPEKPSKDWGSAHVRICTWARLVDQNTKQPLYVYNTHMDDGSQKARENGARLIMKHIRGQTNSDPFILMGDFNAPENSDAIAYMKGARHLTDQTPVQVVDSFRVLHPQRKNVGTYNGFTGETSGSKIDYVFVTPGIRILEASILTTNRNGRYPSDHFPVTARLRLEQKASSPIEQDTSAEQGDADQPATAPESKSQGDAVNRAP